MSLEKLNPGDAVQLTDATQLAVFEDIVAHEVDPTMTPHEELMWAGRVALGGLIRPPKFNGTIENIELVVMDSPFERLLDARERGWKLVGCGTPSHDDEVIESHRGFTLLADARSTGRGIIGQIQAELWFSKVSVRTQLRKHYHKNGDILFYPHWSKNTGNNGGTSVKRRMTIPKIESDKFIELHETSRRIGFEVLRDAMSHPIVQPMHS